MTALHFVFAAAGTLQALWRRIAERHASLPNFFLVNYLHVLGNIKARLQNSGAGNKLQWEYYICCISEAQCHPSKVTGACSILN